MRGMQLIKLTLTVDDEFDKKDLVRTINANDAYLCIDEINDIFREPYKYGTFDGKELSEDQILLFDKVHDKIKEIIENLPERF